ncbi:hypothetical protein, partial [Benzoatithermus flavus]
TTFYPDEQKRNYSNLKIQFVDLDSSFSVLNQTGTMIDPSQFTINENGVISFNQARTDNFILVSGLIYLVKSLVTVTRGLSGEIESVSVEKLTN